MRNYEARKPSYFATPSPQLIRALHTSLTQVLSVPLSDRFAAHHQASLRIKKAVTDLGLKQLAEDPKNQANGMTAFYLPESVKATDLLSKLLEKGVILAGGLHKDIKSKYVRLGHMGVSVVSILPAVMVKERTEGKEARTVTDKCMQTDPTRGDIDGAIEALQSGLQDLGYQKE